MCLSAITSTKDNPTDIEEITLKVFGIDIDGLPRGLFYDADHNELDISQGQIKDKPMRIPRRLNQEQINAAQPRLAAMNQYTAFQYAVNELTQRSVIGPFGYYHLDPIDGSIEKRIYIPFHGSINAKEWTIYQTTL